MGIIANTVYQVSNKVKIYKNNYIKKKKKMT